MGFVVGGGAEERVRPGWANASGDDSLPQRFPIFVGGGGGVLCSFCIGVRGGGEVWGMGVVTGAFLGRLR